MGSSVAIFDSKSGKCVKLFNNAHSDYVNAVVFVNNLFISLSILTNIIHLYNYDNAINYELGGLNWTLFDNFIFSIKYNLMVFLWTFFMLTLI